MDGQTEGRAWPADLGRRVQQMMDVSWLEDRESTARDALRAALAAARRAPARKEEG